MFNTIVLLLMLVGMLIVAKFLFAKLAVIHALTNSGMGSALTATVVALRSDAKSKRQLAGHIGGREQMEAADAADVALKHGEALLAKHNSGQKMADEESTSKFFG